MPGPYLTAAEKRQIEKNNWNMVIGEIEAALKVVRGPKQRTLLQGMLKAGKTWNGAGVIKLAMQLCRLTKKVPPGCYYQAGKEFHLPGAKVTLPRGKDAWALGLVHPQIYR